MTSDEMRRELAAGERVLWYARALRGLRWETGDLAKSAFGLVFFAFSIHGALNVKSNSTSHEGTFFFLFALLFVLVGFYLFIGHFFWNALCRNYIEYGITTRRVIVCSGMFSRTVKSIEYRKIPTLMMTEKADGSGTIQFGEAKIVNQGEGSSVVATKIDAVPDVRSVYNILRKASASELVPASNG